MDNALKRQYVALLYLYDGSKPNYKVPQTAPIRFKTLVKDKLVLHTKGLIRHDRVCQRWTDTQVNYVCNSMVQDRTFSIRHSIKEYLSRI